jgi:hypothetical protein
MLREIHHGYMSSLLADFIESDTKQSCKEIQYSNNTLESLFFTKELADILDEIDKGNVKN